MTTTVYDQTLERILRWRENPDPVWGLSTGLEALDGMTGGLHEGELTILAARPSMGKTALASQIAYHVAQQFAEDGSKRWVVFFSAEMSGWQVVLRELSALLQLPQNAIKGGSISEQQLEAAKAMLDVMRTWPIHIDDTPSISSELAVTRLKEGRDKRGKEVGLVLFDYIQQAGDRADGGYQRANQVVTNLVRITKEFECPLIALSQLNRKVEERNPPIPQLSDLRDSGTLEQAADNAWMLLRDVYYDHSADKSAPHEATLYIEKARNNGHTGTVTLEFVPQLTRFRNLS